MASQTCLVPWDHAGHPDHFPPPRPDTKGQAEGRARRLHQHRTSSHSAAEIHVFLVRKSNSITSQSKLATAPEDKLLTRLPSGKHPPLYLFLGEESQMSRCGSCWLPWRPDQHRETSPHHAPGRRPNPNSLSCHQSQTSHSSGSKSLRGSQMPPVCVTHQSPARGPREHHTDRKLLEDGGQALPP